MTEFEKGAQYAVRLLKRLEGVVLHVYKDSAGYPTIGVGHLIKPGEKFTTITEQEAEDLLRKDMRIAIRDVETAVMVPLKWHQYAALISFAFNIGGTAFRKSAMLRRINRRDFAGAAEEFQRWRYAGGKESLGLINRRITERDTFTGNNIIL